MSSSSDQPTVHQSTKTDFMVISPVEESHEVIEQDFEILPIFFTIARYWKSILVCLGISVLVGLLYIATEKEFYEASITMLPETPTGALGLAGGGLGAVASVLGVAAPGGGKEPFVEILGSRSFNERVVQNMNLMPVIFPDAYEEYKEDKESPLPSILQGAAVLSNRITGEYGETLFTIRVRWPEDAKVAAKVANQVANELMEYFQQHSTKKAKEDRIFIEQQIQIVAQEMKQYEQQLLEFSQRYKMLSPQDHISIISSSIANLKSQLVTKNIELNLLPASSIRVSVLKNEIQLLRKEIHDLEFGYSENDSPLREVFPVVLSEFPQLTLEYGRLKYQLETKQTVYNLLVGQLENIKVQEARKVSSLQVLDPALVPDDPSYPNKAVVLGISLILGFVGSLFVIFLRAKGLLWFKETQQKYQHFLSETP